MESGDFLCNFLPVCGLVFAQDMAEESLLTQLTTSVPGIGVLVSMLSIIITLWAVIYQMYRSRQLQLEKEESDFWNGVMSRAESINEYMAEHKIPGPRVVSMRNQKYLKRIGNYKLMLDSDEAARTAFFVSIFNQTALAHFIFKNKKWIRGDDANQQTFKTWYVDGVINWARELEWADDTLEEIAKGDGLLYSMDFIKAWVRPAVEKYPAVKLKSLDK